MLNQVGEKFSAWVFHKIVKADTRPDKHLFHLGNLPQPAQEQHWRSGSTNRAICLSKSRIFTPPPVLWPPVCGTPGWIPGHAIGDIGRGIGDAARDLTGMGNANYSGTPSWEGNSSAVRY